MAEGIYGKLSAWQRQILINSRRKIPSDRLGFGYLMKPQHLWQSALVSP
jgi:hypothetical protein